VSTTHADHLGVADAPLDREDVRTILIVLGDLNVNIRAIRELLEEVHGEDSEDDS
jgi:hypothetical protein